MADLPKERLIPYEPPFTYTGVDFFGPFYVKRGRGSDKVYGCIFTCFTSHAVHVEDVSSLETDAFIQVLRRFISNQDELNKHLIKDEISYHLCLRSEWKFQPPAAYSKCS